MGLQIVKSLSCVRLFATPWTVAYQAPLSMGFSRQQYWSGLPFPSPGDLPNPAIKPRSPALQTDALPSEPPGKSINGVSALLKQGKADTCGLTIYSIYSFMKVKLFSRVRLFATPWTVTYQALLSMGFSRQEYWNGLPFPSPGDLPNPAIKPRSPALQADALPSEPPGQPCCCCC